MPTSSIKTHLRDLLIDSAAWNLRQRARDKRELLEWEQAGRPVPAPHLVKESILAAYGSAFGADTLIETGTYLGGMVYAMKDRFRQIVSIELGEDLAKKAQHRFRDFPHIRICQGDSATALPEILAGISTPCLFWLDGHYSGGITAKGALDTPVMREVRTILDHKIKTHVLLIDDARCFDGTQDYPTIPELRALIAADRPEFDFSVANDVIRIHERRPVQTEF